MIYLDAPYPVIDGVSFIRDSRSELDWYYLPLAPRFASRRDAAAGDIEVPSFSLVKYRGGRDRGGLLSFDVECGVAPERLTALGGRLQALMRLPEPPRLMPVPLVSGSVRLTILDLETGQTPDPTAPVRFTRAIRHSATPSLYGQNSASFSVQLEAAGVTALEAAMKGELSPIGVVYDLEFLALRPAYAVTLNVDWDRLQTYMDERFGVDVLFFSTDIDNAVDELVESRVIEMKTDTFVPEGEDERAVLSRRDRAISEVREMITQGFFEPSVNPAATSEDGWDKAAHLATSISRLAVTGGWSALGGFSYRKSSERRMDDKTLNVVMSERTTVRRRIAPQGHLGGFFRMLRDGGVDLDRFITEVDIDADPFFRRRRLSVVPRVDFAREAVTSVDVSLRYGDAQPRSVVFTPADNAPQQVEWPLQVTNGAEVPVTADYRVNLATVTGHDRPASMRSPAQSVTGDVLEVLSRDLYEVTPVTVTALDVPWDRYPSVEVGLRYEDTTSGVRASDMVLLSAERPEAVWNLFTPAAGTRAFGHTITYRGNDIRDVVRAEVVSNDTTITVRTPFPRDRRRSLEIWPQVDWTQYRTVFVDVRYEDAANDILDEGAYTFTEGDAAPRTHVVDLADPGQRLMGFTITAITRDGTVVESPPSQTLDRRVIVRPGMLGHRIVDVLPATGDFAKRRVASVTAELVYEDTLNGIRFADVFTLTGGADRGSFEFDYADAARTSLRYRTKTTWLTGLTSRGGWTEADARKDLVVPIGDAN